MNTLALPPSRSLPPWALALCLLVALGAQVGSVRGEFVLDDVPVVRHNPALAGGALAVGRLLREPSWPGELEVQPYRPLALAALAVDRALWGGPAAAHVAQGMRLTNLAWHLLAVGLLLSLLARLWPGRTALTVCTTLVFAAHPLVAGAVGAAVGRAELLSLALALGALRAWLAYEPGRPAFAPLAVLLAFLALLAKEAWIGLPLVCWGLCRFGARSGVPLPVRARLPGLLALAGMLGLYALLWPGPGRSPAAGTAVTGLDTLLLGLEGLGRAALKVLVPVGLSADRSTEALAGQGFPVSGAPLILALTTGLAVCFAWLAPRGAGSPGVLRSAWSCAAALALPAVYTLPAGAWLEDRPSVLLLPALALPLGLLCEALVLRATAHGRLVGRWAVGAAILALAVLSQREAGAGRSDEGLTETLLRREPEHAPAMLRMARRHVADALREHEAATRLPSGDPRHGEHVERKRVALESALSWNERAVRMPALSSSSEAWYLLGMTRLESDDPSGAAAALERARQLEPLLAGARATEATRADPAAWERAARIYSGLGRVRTLRGQLSLAANDHEEAARHEREAARLAGRPWDVALLFRAAVALIADGRYDVGLPLTQEVALASLDDDLRRQATDLHARARRDASHRLEKLLVEASGHYDSGHWRSAAETYEEAMRVAPDYVEARLRAARLRGQYFGAYALARAYVREGLERLARAALSETVTRDRQRLEALAAELAAWEREDEAEEAREGTPR